MPPFPLAFVASEAPRVPFLRLLRLQGVLALLQFSQARPGNLSQVRLRLPQRLQASSPVRVRRSAGVN